MPNGDGTGPLGNGCRGGRLRQGQQDGSGKGMGKSHGRGLGICRNQKKQTNTAPANQSDENEKA